MTAHTAFPGSSGGRSGSLRVGIGGKGRREHVFVSAEVEVARHGTVFAEELVEAKACARIFKPGLGAEFFDFEQGEEFLSDETSIEIDGLVEREDVHD